MENTENMIEFISGTRTATVTFTNQKHINRKWVKINAGSLPGTGKKREMTEEQKEALRQRLAAGRAKAAKNTTKKK